MFKMFQAKEKKATKQAPILIQESKDGEWFEELDDADLLSVVGGANVGIDTENGLFGYLKSCLEIQARVRAGAR